jgi:hypothetical protein
VSNESWNVKMSTLACDPELEVPVSGQEECTEEQEEEMAKKANSAPRKNEGKRRICMKRNVRLGPFALEQGEKGRKEEVSHEETCSSASASRTR